MQINLSYTNVTDLGLLSLARISCLQSVTLLHREGVTPAGLAAALLACSGLTKVKLQASFKSLLPPRLFEHLEARGCSLQWREKVFQVHLQHSGGPMNYFLRPPPTTYTTDGLISFWIELILFFFFFFDRLNWIQSVGNCRWWIWNRWSR